MKHVPVKDHPHPVGTGGRQMIYHFPNNWGASVVRFMIGATTGSYTTGDQEWEVAVLRRNPDDEWDLSYTSGITDDVIGHVHERVLDALLDRIAALPDQDVIESK